MNVARGNVQVAVAVGACHGRVAMTALANPVAKLQRSCLTVSLAVKNYLTLSLAVTARQSAPS